MKEFIGETMLTIAVIAIVVGQGAILFATGFERGIEECERRHEAMAPVTYGPIRYWIIPDHPPEIFDISGAADDWTLTPYGAIIATNTVAQ